jgi:hypothetical protein
VFEKAVKLAKFLVAFFIYANSTGQQTYSVGGRSKNLKGLARDPPINQVIGLS